jgi:serine/threonine protein kinase
LKSKNRNKKNLIPKLPITQKIVKKIMRDLLGSLFLMHMNGIVHFDIKLLNVMYHQNVDRWVFIDFGAADRLTSNNVRD